MKRFLGILVVGAAVVAAPVSAATVSARDIVQQFNIVTFGDLSTVSDVEGRAYVGGNLAGAGAKVFNNRPAATPSTFDNLVVRGDVTGGTVHVNNGGSAVVGGDVRNDNFNLNGHGSLAVGGAVAASTIRNQGTVSQGLAGTPGFEDRFPQDVESVLKAASTTIRDLGGAAPTLVGERKLVFGATPGAGSAVYNLDFALLSAAREIELVGDGASTILINVSGRGGAIADNFIGGSWQAAANVLWNFHEAEAIDFKTQFVGSILAPMARIAARNNIEGTLVALSADLHGEMHSQPYAGDVPSPAPVPLPATLPLLVAGLGALGALRRRRRLARPEVAAA